MNMQTDNQLREFFQSRKPAVGDGDIFMDSLKARLLAVEGIRRMKEAQGKRARKALGIVFLCGVLAGILLVRIMQEVSLPETLGRIMTWFEAVPEAVKYLLCAAVAAAALLPSLKALASE